MILLLTILTAVLILVLVVALIAFVAKIADGLLSIGSDPTSYLAKINFGVRAIETETSVIQPEVSQLNDTLQKIAAGLQAIDRNLAMTIDAVGRQELP